ncbi:rho-associated protein kinase 1-like isoform X2 [Convolutriloba macropyga]|uniref:rho-associated protein kinase 1-like isoform X2 n=1 Tax=Convolutriloba macropyga TaxID=536237 RepID=UPI003F51E8B0
MDSNRANTVSDSLCSPQSLLNADTFMDCMNALIKEVSIPAFKSNKCVDAFMKRYRKDYDALERYRVSTSDFTVVSMLGKGAFGQVKLVRHNASENVYAMKCILKSEMLTRPEGMSSFWEERFIMAFARSDWIVKCHWAFQDTKYLYMVMDYMPGGNLLSGILDNEELSIDENLIRFYTAEMILAIEALHNMGFAHRDIKPDNCLINSKGHLKVTDFGTAIRLDPDGLIRCSTAVGTPDYISPEVLKSQSSSRSVYGQECDWWSLGVVIFEMKYQDTPFYDDTLVKTYSRINNHVDKIDFPSDEEDYEPSSPEIMDLIEKCLIADRTKRLGHNGARELKAHSFFNKKLWTWENIHTYPAPFDPKIDSITDTKHFKYEGQDDNSNKFSSIDIHQKNQFSAEQLPFIGFSYCPEVYARLTSGSGSSETVISLQKQLDEATKNSEKYQNSYNKAEMSRSKVETENNDLKRKLAKIEVENTSYIKKFEDVSTNLHKATAENAASKTELDSLRNENKKLKNATGDKLTQLEEEKQGLSESLMAEKNKNGEIARKMGETEKRLKDVQVRWERECDENKNLINDLQNRQKEFDTVYIELSSCQAKVNSLEDKIKLQKDQLDALTKAESDVKTNLAEKTSELSELKWTYEQLRVMHEQSKEKILELSVEIEGLNENAKNTTIQEENDEINSLKKQISQDLESKRLISEKLRITEQELYKAKYDLDSNAQLITGLKAKASENEQTIDNLNTTLSEMKLEKSKINVELKRKIGEIETLKTKETNLGKEILALKESKKFWEAEKIRLEQELDSSRQSVKETNDECESLHMKMTLLSNKIEDLKDDNAEVEKEKDDLLEKLQAKEELVKSLEAKLTESQEANTKLEADLLELTQKLHLEKISQEEELNKAKFKLDKKTEEVAELRNLVENGKSEKTDLNSKIKALNEEIQQLNEKIKTLQGDNGRLLEERKRLIEHFSNYVNKDPTKGDGDPDKLTPAVPHSDKAKENVAVVIREKKKLEMELDNYKRNVKKYETEISHTRHEIDVLKDAYEAQIRENQELKANAHKLTETVRTLESGGKRSGSVISVSNILQSGVNDTVSLIEEIRREGKLEIQQSHIMNLLQDKKSQASKKTQKFVEQWAVLEAKQLLFYKTAEDRNMRKNATQIIDLTRLIYVRQAQASELFREKKEDVESKIFQIVFSQNEGIVRKKDPDVILEWAYHQMRDFTGNIGNLTCDACQKPFKSQTFTLRSASVAVIECKHCNKKYHKDNWSEEKLQMHKCPLANKANDVVMFIKATGSVDKQEWMKELNKFCAAFHKKATLNSASMMRFQ